MIKDTIEFHMLVDILDTHSPIDGDQSKFKAGEHVKVKDDEENINGWVFWAIILPGDNEPSYAYVTEGFKKVWWSKESDLELIRKDKEDD